MRRAVLMLAAALIAPASASAAAWHTTSDPPGALLLSLVAEADGTLVGTSVDGALTSTAAGPFVPQSSGVFPDGDLIAVAGGLRAVDVNGEITGSDDHGSTWHAVGSLGALRSTDSQPDIVAWALDRDTPDHLVRLHFDGSVQRSIDGGASWRSAAPFELEGVNGLASGTFSGGAAYLAADATLWRSTDLGDSWQSRGDVPEGRLLAGAAGRLWVSGETGVWRSADGGATWRHSTGRVELLVPSPDEPGVAWTVRGRRIRLTADGGATWRTVPGLLLAPSPVPFFFVDAQIAPLPGRHASACVAARRLVWCSTAGGAFTPDLARTSSTTGGYDDLAIDPVRTGHAIAVTGGMIWETTDGGRAWLPVGEGPAVPTSVAITRRGVFIGTEDGVVARSAGATSWRRRPGPRGSTTVAAEPLTGTVYAIASGKLWRSSGGAFRRAPARGVPGSVQGLPESFLFRFPQRPITVGGHGRSVLVRSRRHLYLSTDGGGHFRRIDAPGAGDLPVAADPRDRRHVLVLTSRGLLATRDGGRTWRRSTAASPLAVAADPSHRGRWFAIWSGAIRISTDGARTWRRYDREPAPTDTFCCELQVGGGRLWHVPSFGFAAISWRRIGP